MLKPIVPLSFSVIALLTGTAVSSAAPPTPAQAAKPPLSAGKLVQIVDPRQGQKLFQKAIRLTEEGQTVAAEETGDGVRASPPAGDDVL